MGQKELFTTVDQHYADERRRLKPAFDEDERSLIEHVLSIDWYGFDSDKDRNSYWEDTTDGAHRSQVRDRILLKLSL